MSDNFFSKIKRLLSSFIATTMLATMLPAIPASAEDTVDKYPYTLFAASNEEGAITVNAGNFCVNGNVATNGTIGSSGNMNINGTKTENADEKMIYILKKLNYAYFTGDNVDIYPDDYSYEDMNININDPMDVKGELELTGNINLNTGIKALEDVTLNGEVKNTNNSVICSETGNIIIDSTNVNLNGLVYAPYGDVEITAQNLNLNNVIIIADTITFNCPSVNANYSSSMAELVGTESDIDVELYAFGEYNSEVNSIDSEWYTNYTNSDYEVLVSDDNVNFTSIATVSDVTTYQYLITEDFETKYFKVSLTTNYGEIIESIPFVVSKTEDGYTTDFLDSDGDGLADIYEVSFGTNINNSDTDEDGLTDYEEVYLTGTDPTKYDSVTEGVSDSDADSDSDGLSNAQEIDLGTDPQKADSDSDGLSDYDEINVYGTDPLKTDTDEDSINDGDEIVLSLDPNKQDTDNNGTFDGDEYFEQNVDKSRFDNTLFDNNNAVPSALTVSAKGNVNSNINISEYTGYLKGEERAYVGKVIEISDSEINSGSLTFTLSQNYDVNSYEFGGELTNGLLIFYNDGENTTPLATIYDEKTKTLKADISSDGIYFVLDVMSWMNSLGLDLSTETEVDSYVESSAKTLSTRTVSSATTSIANLQIKGQVDIVFVIDTTGSMGSYISNVKNNVTAFVDEIETAGISPSFALVEYQDITWDGNDSTNVKKNGNSNWFKNADDFKTELNKLSLGDGGDIPETAIDALEMSRQLDLRTSSQKFFVLVTDAGYKIDNNYGIKSMSEMINLLADDEINVSVVSNSSYQSTYKSLYESTGGVFANVGGNFKDELLAIADMINEETNSGCWIALNGLIPQIVKLDERPTTAGTADSDDDTLLDIEELKSVEPTKHIDVEWYLQLLGLPLDYDYPTVPVYDYYSNPTKKDSDDDGYYDGSAYIVDGVELLPKDPKPLKYEVAPYLEDLCELAVEYEDNFEKSQKLVVDYIRAGKYNDNAYLGAGNWENTSGEINTKFIDYVNEKNPEIQKYLYSQNVYDTKYYKDPVTNEVIDLSHLAATFSAYLYDTNDFKMWAGSLLKGIPNYTEDDIDNLSGWVGDLQSMVQMDLLIYYDYAMGESWTGDHYFDRSVLNQYDEEYYTDLVHKLLEDKLQNDGDTSTYILLNNQRIKNTSFKIEDQLADIDAVNLYINCYRPNDKTTIADCLNRYYSKIDGNRFCGLRYDVFIDNVFSMEDDYTYDSKYWDFHKAYLDGNITSDEYKSAIIDLFYDYTLKYTMENAPDGKKWTLYSSSPVVDNVSKGTAKAFSEYIVGNWSW